jgi:pyruvate dehydrogenase E1 component alpha subunit
MPASTKKDAKNAAPAQPTAEASHQQIDDIAIPTQIEMLRMMLRIRRLEERSAQLYQQQKIGGFCHLYIGQEAVAAGALAAIRPDDYVMTTYRDHGLAVGRGIPAEACFAELLGRIGGCSKGRGGSMHFFSRELNFLGGHGIVGGHIPLATGTAFASKYRGEDRVSLCFFGDGAVNNGAFHESLNLASLWELPIIYLCENNRYGMGTPVERASSIYDIYKKAEGYDMDHDCLDGMDVLSIYRGLKKAVEKARQGKPSFIEIRTYRFRGHSMSDPIHSHYRTKAEVEEQKERDPIKLWRESLVARGIISDEEIQKMDKDINAEMKKAAEKAELSPEPDPADVYKFVLAE